jgi:glycosyltransferase involved in cell wall biosynthesis
MKEINLITNEKISINKKNYFCDNLEMKAIILGLKKKFKLNFFCRNSNIKRQHSLSYKKVFLSKNIYFYLQNILSTINNKNSIYLVISITPYTFIAAIFLMLFNKKIFLYLRSDGFEEYKIKFGFLGHFIYFLMFYIVTQRSKIITNNIKILRNRKGSILKPSMLDSDWKKNIKIFNRKEIKLLYVGRFKIEKGVFSLIKIFKKLKNKITLTIVGIENNQQIFNEDKRIKFQNIIFNKLELIDLFDQHSILILPSFTEAYGMVIDEALSRLRPVIIFEEIKSIINGRKGVFVCKRNHKSLEQTINQIMRDYNKIKKEIKKNKLPNKEKFINSLQNFLSI